MSNIYPYKGILPTIADSAFTAPSADIIGDVVIGEQSTVWFNCTVRGDVNEVRIGNQTSIQDNTVIHVARRGQGTYVGDRVKYGLETQQRNFVMYARKKLNSSTPTC